MTPRNGRRPMRGAIIVAYGTAARREALGCIASLQGTNPELTVAVISDLPLGKAGHLYAPATDRGAREAKLSQYALSPFEQTLYLDADTRVKGDLSAGFAVLDDGWEMAIAYSGRQGRDWLGNCTEADRKLTVQALGTDSSLAWQCGVMFWRHCPAVERLFARWQAEWEKRREMDQGAFLRALWGAPVRLWLLGKAWNGGELIEHRWGRATR